MYLCPPNYGNFQQTKWFLILAVRLNGKFLKILSLASCFISTDESQVGLGIWGSRDCSVHWSRGQGDQTPMAWPHGYSYQMPAFSAQVSQGSALSTLKREPVMQLGAEVLLKLGCEYIIPMMAQSWPSSRPCPEMPGGLPNFPATFCCSSKTDEVRVGKRKTNESKGENVIPQNKETLNENSQ